MIRPLQAIIGYGTKATIYCPSTLQLFNTPSCSVLLLLAENSTCPLFTPSFYSPLPWEHVPGEDHCSLLSFYLASGKQAPCPPLSITFNHPHVHSALRPFHRPFLPPSFPPVFLSMLTTSQLLTTALLIRVLHLSISIYLFPVVFFPTILPLLDAFTSGISSAWASVLEDAVSFVL